MIRNLPYSITSIYPRGADAEHGVEKQLRSGHPTATAPNLEVELIAGRDPAVRILARFDEPDGRERHVETDDP